MVFLPRGALRTRAGDLNTFASRAGVNTPGSKYFGLWAEIGEQIKAAVRVVDLHAGFLQFCGEPPSQGSQDAPRPAQVFIDLLVLLKGPDGGVLDRCASRGERLAGHRCHRILQPSETSRKCENAQPPTTGTAPFAQASAENGPLWVEWNDRGMLPLVVQLAVDLVGQQDDPVFPRHLGERSQLIERVRRAGGI